MFKSVKNKATRLALIVLTSLFGLWIVVYLGFYLSVPYYHFDTPHPFSGDYLYNPYQNMKPEEWKKCNFHCHSRKFFGLTNGRLSKEEDIDSIYQYLGYDHYGISDYMSINRHNEGKEDYIPAYEHGYGIFRKTHQLCIGAEKVWRIDFPFVQNLNIKQHAINKLQERARFAVPAHASFTNGYKPADMIYLSNYRLLEVLNPYGNALNHWDIALSNGHRVYGIGDDDTHNINNKHEVALNITVINTHDLKAENVYNALEKGLSYTVELNKYYFHPQSLEFKKEKIENLPYLTRAELRGDTLFIETSAKKMQEVVFIGQNGDTLCKQNDVQTAFYAIQPDDTYVRTVINIDKLHLLYLNPITRHPSPEALDRHLDSINLPQTILIRSVYILAIIVAAVSLFRNWNRKQKAHE